MVEDKPLRERVARQGEEAIGKLAQELLENPVVSSALAAAIETRERAVRAQEVAMGALNLPSASDLERLTRRLRGVSQRLEGLEDGVDRLDQRIDGLGRVSALEQRLTAIEEALARVEAAVTAKPPRTARTTRTAQAARASRPAKTPPAKTPPAKTPPAKPQAARAPRAAKSSPLARRSGRQN